MRQAPEKDQCVKVFLRNFLPVNGMECLLRETLDSAECLNAEFQEWSVNRNEEVFGQQQLSNRRFRSGQGLLLILLNADSLAAVCRWVAQLQDRHPEVPVIA